MNKILFLAYISYVKAFHLAFVNYSN